jgi:hypothetical protein
VIVAGAAPLRWKKSDQEKESGAEVSRQVAVVVILSEMPCSWTVVFKPTVTFGAKVPKSGVAVICTSLKVSLEHAPPGGICPRTATRLEPTVRTKTPIFRLADDPRHAAIVPPTP